MNAQTHRKAAAHDVRVFSTEVDLTDLPALLDRMLPDQGDITVRRDVAGKEHFSLAHVTDETYVVLSGFMRFFWDSGEKIAGPGTLIALPAGIPRGSVALTGGATYLVAYDNFGMPLPA